jgi:hypothetical protein
MPSRLLWAYRCIPNKGLDCKKNDLAFRRARQGPRRINCALPHRAIAPQFTPSTSPDIGVTGRLRSRGTSCSGERLLRSPGVSNRPTTLNSGANGWGFAQSAYSSSEASAPSTSRLVRPSAVTVSSPGTEVWGEWHERDGSPTHQKNPRCSHVRAAFNADVQQPLLATLRAEVVELCPKSFWSQTQVTFRRAEVSLSHVG